MISMNDQFVSKWRIDKIKLDGSGYWKKVVFIILNNYPHSGSHAMRVGWEKHRRMFRKIYDEGFVLAPEQISLQSQDDKRKEVIE